MPDTCPHEQDIGILKNTVNKLDETVNGNGKDGLKIEVERTKLAVEAMSDDIGSIRTSMSAIAKSQIERDAIERSKVQAASRKNKTIERIGTIAAIVFGAVGILYVILDHVSNH